MKSNTLGDVMKGLDGINLLFVTDRTGCNEVYI